MKSPSQIRSLMREGGTVGTWLQFPSPDVAEIMAQAGYDWVAVDMEHGSFGASSLPNIFRSIECGGSAPFARLPEAEKIWIKMALEAGACGLIFPMIESGAQLSHAIYLSTYPGQDDWRKSEATAPAYRGVGFCRANAFGARFASYRENVAKELVLVAQIEHIRAISALDEILSHPRLDAIMVGPYDLSGSMGLTGNFKHPEFLRAMAEIEKKCHEHGVCMGTHVVSPNPQQLREALAKGYRFIAYGIDTVFLREAAARPQAGKD